jgi:uncharacterized protein YecE (DUF72 family)
MSQKAGRLRIGASGYQYAHWKGTFYPPDLPKKDWFAYYAQRFDTVEINNTFYRLPQARTFDAWGDQAPEGFCYALKFSRYTTHLKRLKEPHDPIKRFLERASRLGEFIGPILVQLPPHWRVDTERLTTFLSQCGNAETVPLRMRGRLCDVTLSRPCRGGVRKLAHRHAGGHTPPQGMIPDLRSIVEDGPIGRADKALSSSPLPFTQAIW